jgi:hypothetical protein
MALDPLNQIIYYINTVSDRIDTDFYFIGDSEFEELMEKATSTGGELQREGL